MTDRITFVLNGIQYTRGKRNKVFYRTRQGEKPKRIKECEWNLAFMKFKEGASA